MLSEKEYENLIIKHDKFTEDTLIALGLVKKYIVKHDLIIVGGMAIDMSLKLKGSKLYEDDVLPDYDFYSPHHHKDAYKIAEILYKAGMPNITVINANHTSTMRVRVNYVVVADVTYIPPDIYDNLPVLIYKDMRIIHPHFQMIDQHRALSIPYENPPWEVISHRWTKDARRHDLLYNHYPLKKIKDLTDIPPNNDFILSNDHKISAVLFRDQCIGGFVGLLYWERLAKKLGFKSKHVYNLGSLHEDTGGIVAKIPVDSHGVTVYSNDIIALRTKLEDTQEFKNERKYNRFLDKLPFKIILGAEWELFDNKGYLLSAHKTDTDIHMANLQNIMLYMLTNYMLLHKIKNIKRGYSFYVGYLLAREIVQWAGNSYSKHKSAKQNKYKIFLPSADVYGVSDISDSYLNSKRLFLENIKHIKRRQLQPPLVFSNTFKNGKIPEQYYKFSTSNSPLFQFDGSETKKYVDRIYL